MSSWTCVVQFPDGTEELRETDASAPIIDTVWKIAGKNGLWRVTGHTLENYDCWISVVPVAGYKLARQG